MARPGGAGSLGRGTSGYLWGEVRSESYREAEYVIDKAYAKKLRSKRATFARVTKTKKALFLTLVTTYGVRDNDHARALGVSSITLDALFHAV